MMRFLLSLFCVFAFTVTAFAEEKITNFDVLIDVQKNGDFIVTETIEVDAEGRQIRRGIFRDIPRYQLLDGKYKVPQRISVMSIARDGTRSPFMKENKGNALQIKIGEASVFLDPGAYAYEIKYRMNNQVRYFDNHDEVYWNATGTYWAFPIEKASATISLPPGASVQEQNAYTGPEGSQGHQYTYTARGDDHIYRTTAPLGVREGLTVSLSFDKGLIDPPTSAEKGFLWWVRNGALILFSVSLLGITAYYYRAWNRVGRDPAKGPVFARYEAPKDYSPAALSHIHYKGVRGHKPLIATLVGLSIKGYLELDTGKKITVISKVDPPAGAEPMNAEEALLLKKLFGKKRTGNIQLKGKHNPKFHNSNLSFTAHLRKAFGKDYQRWNIGYIVGGVFMSIAAFVAAISQIYGYFAPGYIVLIIGLIAVNILFMFLLPAPTKKGQELGTEIDGFKLYMDTAEKMRINAAKVIGADQPPPMTTKRYETFLPYAIALGVEKPWSKHFEAAMPEEAKNYNPAWSHGDFSSGRSLSRMTDSMVSNISSGASSAAPPSSSSSGGGGGGSSGGGGGGGGGGGW